jgi:hypothetical protein
MKKKRASEYSPILKRILAEENQEMVVESAKGEGKVRFRLSLRDFCGGKTNLFKELPDNTPKEKQN